tara:strand:+ start:614 stop:931 length:318 start_codon:yes stop_codon:yes gene_type:complete
MAEEVIFSRSFVELVNNEKVLVNFDFAHGEYIATKSFFEKMSEIQSGILSTGKVMLETGQIADINDTGGLIAIQLYMDSLDSTRQAMSGLAKSGLNVEKQVWKFQ